MCTLLINTKDTNSLIDALQIMNIHYIRILDIINTEQKLVGIPTDR